MLGALSTAITTGALWAQEAPVYEEEKNPHLLKIEELETTLDASVVRNHKLEGDLKNLQMANGVLAESLAKANEQLEELNENYKDAVILLEAVGAESFEGQNGEGLRDRLKKAVSDLRLITEEKEKLANVLIKLISKAQDYAKKSENADSKARVDLEVALREGDEALGLIFRQDQFAEKTIDDAKVITVNKQFNMVVLDVGIKQGMRVGTPLKIQRKDRTIASALVVDVRDIIAGAVIIDQNDPNDNIRVNDTVRLDPQGA